MINADFILPSSREDILKEEPWNDWLMDCVADLVASMLLPALKEKRLLTADFLEKPASRLNDFGTVYGVDRDNLLNSNLHESAKSIYGQGTSPCE